MDNDFCLNFCRFLEHEGEDYLGNSLYKCYFFDKQLKTTYNSYIENNSPIMCLECLEKYIKNGMDEND